MRWRVGILYRSIELLELIVQGEYSEADLISSFGSNGFRGVAITDIIDVCYYNSWIELTEQDVICCSNSGLDLIKLNNADVRLREQISSLIEKENPQWATASVQGRQALATYAPSEAVQCFREAGLLNGDDDDVIKWWDTIASKYRIAKDQAYLNIGRLGEKKTIELEIERTGQRPQWIAVEYSNAGYDVISCISKDDPTPLVIEVKTSVKPWDYASFYISRSEWDILANKKNATLHLWSIYKQQPCHSCVGIDLLREHIPHDYGNGTWHRCQVPFNSFRASHE